MEAGEERDAERPRGMRSKQNEERGVPVRPAHGALSTLAGEPLRKEHLVRPSRDLTTGAVSPTLSGELCEPPRRQTGRWQALKRDGGSNTKGSGDA